MSAQPPDPASREARAAAHGAPRNRPSRLMSRTLHKAWDGSLFSEAAEAAFWQTLSLPPLLLGLLGSLGYVAEWFGPDIIQAVHGRIITFSNTIFSGNVVHDIISPTVSDILSKGRGEIVSIGFVISLWAGSSAMSSFVDAITVAHDQYGERNLVWQRIFALLLYLASLVLLIVGLPLIALGPDVLPNFFPVSWRPEVSQWVGALYYPAIGTLGVLAVATLYKVALPRKLPWHRGLPGAALAMLPSLPRDEAIVLLRQRLDALEAQRDKARAQADALVDPPHVRELFGLWESQAAGGAEWTRGLIERLEAGAYPMAGEPRSPGEPGSWESLKFPPYPPRDE